MLDATEVAKLLTEIALRMELGGEPSFKTRAYQNAADSLLAMSQPLAEVVSKGKLKELPGVGEAIAEKIIKLHKTGTHPTLEYLREQMPAGVLELFQVPGLGPKKVALLYSQLNVASLAQLEEACRANRLDDCKGLGAKLAVKILQSLESIQKRVGLSLIDDAARHLTIACEGLKKAYPALERIVPAGDVRLGREIAGELRIAAQAPDALLAAGLPNVPSDIQVRLGDAAHFGLTLLYATGSAAHIEKLAVFAAAKGFTLSEQGLFQNGQEIFCPEETHVYAALGLSYIKPELREGGDEIELASDGKLPDLVRDSDIKGILHSHTDFSDGASTLSTMAEAVRERGYQYYGVADHSQSAAYAGGMKEDRVRVQHKLADGLNAGYDAKAFKIFKGIESDILEDGSLDYSEQVLSEFDFVVASVHSRFTLDRARQTQRLVAAVSNPHTTILGHMTGRLLLKREPYEIDIDEVLKACAKNEVVVEINAHPQRLDLDWRWHRRAMELGCMLSINPDAHSIPDIDLVRWGVVVARKGGVPASRVLNCMPLDEIEKYFASRKARS